MPVVTEKREVLASACETAGLSEERLRARISDYERLKLLAGMAIAAATRTTWEDKVRTLGRSLASGVLGSDEAVVNTEELIMSAIADMEAPHVALLDLLVASHTPRVEGNIGPQSVEIPEYSHSGGTWIVRDGRDVSPRSQRTGPILPDQGTINRIRKSPAWLPKKHENDYTKWDLCRNQRRR